MSNFTIANARIVCSATKHLINGKNSIFRKLKNNVFVLYNQFESEGFFETASQFLTFL